MKIDLHCHTYYSKDALSSPYDTIKEALKKGLDGIAITDHETSAGWNDAIKAAHALNAFLILGEEIKSNKGDILGLFLKEEIKMEGCDPLLIIDEIHRQGGLVIIPHPFHIIQHFRNLKDYISLIDGIETYNAKNLFKYSNKKALNIALKYNLAMTAGSDCHTSKACGHAYTECEAKNLDEFKECLLKKRSKTFGAKSPYMYMIAPILKKIKNKLSK